MLITKSNGKRVQFNPEKIIHSLTRAGADLKLAKNIAKEVEKKIQENATTADVFRLITKELEKFDIALASKYDLQNALVKLGPTGFKFEVYISEVLKAYGWDAEVPKNDLHGLCTDHEVDVIATKENERIMVEAKFRNKYGDIVTLKDVMATWSRYEDILNAAKAGKERNFNNLWIMTNGRFTDRAEQFGVCKGIHMFSWNSPSHSLPKLIDQAKLYPITILGNIDTATLEKLSSSEIMLCRDLIPEKLPTVLSKTGIPEEKLKSASKTCGLIFKNN